MNKLKNIITYILSFSLILSVLLLTVHFCAFDLSFYKKEHRSLKLYNQSLAEYIGFSNNDLDELTEFTLNYLNDPESTLDKQMIINGELKEVFNDDEKSHMVDVRTLNLNSLKFANILLIIVFVCAIILIILKENIYNIFHIYKKTLIFYLIIFAFIGFWILIDFDSFWTTFHKIFFSGNDLWLLDLTKDVLIMIVPPEFFNHLVTKIVITYVIVIFVICFILYFLSRRKMKKNDSRCIV